MAYYTIIYFTAISGDIPPETRSMCHLKQVQE